MADAGDSFFTRKGSGRAEAKESGGDSAQGEAKGAKAALNDLEDAGDAAQVGAKGGASPPPPRASVGWGSDAAELAGEQKDAGGSAGGEAKRAGRRRKGSDTAAGLGGGAGGGKGGKNRHFDDDGESTEIVEIPDLEEEEREPDITTQIAEAPRNTTRTVQSLKELEKDIKFALPTTGTHGVDLQLLTSALCPEKAVGEADEPWNFDSLLNDVSQELQRDMDEKEEFLRAEAAAAAAT